MPKSITLVPTIPKPVRKKRVAAYARVSTEKDAMLHSLSSQVSYYNELMQSNPEWEYAAVYADESKTGTKDSRAEFQRLIADCRTGKIDMVITKSISRFARNTVTLLQTVRDFKSWGVDIYFEEQNLHTMSADGELMLTILASYAQEESRSASENQKWRIRHNFEEGLPWNGALLGYRLKDGRFDIIPEEAELVRRIFSEYLAGDGYYVIARRLNDEGIPSRFGGKWDQRVISKILANYTYTGNFMWRKRTKPSLIWIPFGRCRRRRREGRRNSPRSGKSRTCSRVCWCATSAERTTGARSPEEVRSGSAVPTIQPARRSAIPSRFPRIFFSK